MKRIKIKENHFVLHPSGAVFWEEQKTLLLADVHLGKVAHFRKNGIAVPRKAEGAFYQKITALLTEFTIERFLFLGDLFHSFQNNEWLLFTAWVKQQKASMILVEGNHDLIPAAQFEQIGLQVVDHLIEKGFYFSHFPTKKTNPFCFLWTHTPRCETQRKWFTTNENALLFSLCSTNDSPCLWSFYRLTYFIP